MRAINGLFCLILVVFALVQFDDPDFLFWFVIYGLAAIWCGLAAFIPEVLTTHGTLRASFLLCLIGALAGTVYFWPTGADWWTKEVIWDNELVREGLGMVIVTIGLLSVGITWWIWAEADEV
ncbi:MAG: transmembrane 220 family protein [Pseudomonadota bacterium]